MKVAGDFIAVATGASLYVIGLVLSNFYFEPFSTVEPTLNLVMIALGVFSLSVFFYGKYSFALMFFSGFLLGPNSDALIFVTLALMPLLFALIGGMEIGKHAFLDLAGKSNLMQHQIKYLTYFLVVIVLSLTIGFLFGNIPFTIPQGIF